MIHSFHLLNGMFCAVPANYAIFTANTILGLFLFQELFKICGTNKYTSFLIDRQAMHTWGAWSTVAYVSIFRDIAEISSRTGYWCSATFWTVRAGWTISSSTVILWIRSGSSVCAVITRGTRSSGVSKFRGGTILT